MPGFYKRGLSDFDDESGSVQVYATELSAANMAAELVKQANFGAAINDMSLGDLQEIRYGNFVASNSPNSMDKANQREIKWRVDYLDLINGRPGYFTIPCAKVTLLSTIARGEADVLDQDVIDFIAATEAYVLSRDAHAITVTKIWLVGRNI